MGRIVVKQYQMKAFWSDRINLTQIVYDQIPECNHPHQSLPSSVLESKYNIHTGKINLNMIKNANENYFNQTETISFI